MLKDIYSYIVKEDRGIYGMLEVHNKDIVEFYLLVSPNCYDRLYIRLHFHGQTPIEIR